MPFIIIRVLLIVLRKFGAGHRPHAHVSRGLCGLFFSFALAAPKEIAKAITKTQADFGISLSLRRLESSILSSLSTTACAPSCLDQPTHGGGDIGNDHLPKLKKSVPQWCVGASHSGASSLTLASASASAAIDDRYARKACITRESLSLNWFNSCS